jgi:glycosyltransferase involved in cell wall biosynthesis
MPRVSHPSPRKKICMISSAHRANDVRVFEKEATSLAESGYDVSFVVPHDRDEKLGPVQIRAVARPKNRIQRMTKTIWHLYRRAKEVDAYIYHLHDPDLIPVGLLLKLCGKRVVYDVHEDVPRDILVKDWIASPLRKAVAAGAEATQVVCGWAFDGILAATPVIAARFPGHRTLTVQNFPRLAPQGTSPATPYASRPFQAIHVGLLDRYRGAHQMALAISKLPESLKSQLVIAGKFNPPHLKQEIQSMAGSERFEYRGWLSREGVMNLLQEGRVGLALAQPWQAYAESQPNKLFEYMAAGLPVIASNFPGWREFILNSNCGLVVDSSDPSAIAEAILWIFDHPPEAEAMGRRGRESVLSKYNWRNQEAILLDFYAQLTHGAAH